MNPPIEDRIIAAFEGYRATTVLLEELAQKRVYPQEIVILACARLDALANLAITQKQSQRDRFAAFLYTYSSKRQELEQVALPNLYFRLFLSYITLPASIPIPGRMWANDLTREATFLQFLVDSGLPIAEEDIAKFLEKFSAWLQRKYRTTVSQAKSKPHTDTVKAVLEHLTLCSHAYRKGVYDAAVEAIKPFVQQFRLVDIIYRDYRSSSIHEFAFSVDDRFFTQVGTYFAPRYHSWDDTRFLELSLSARWIIDLYSDTIANYEQALIAKRKLPMDLWIQICDEKKELAFLDDTSVQVGRDLTIHIGR